MLAKRHRRYRDGIKKVTNHAMTRYFQSLNIKFPQDEETIERHKNILLSLLRRCDYCEKTYNNCYKFHGKSYHFVIGDGSIITYVNKNRKVKDKPSDGLPSIIKKIDRIANLTTEREDN